MTIWAASAKAALRRRNSASAVWPNLGDQVTRCKSVRKYISCWVIRGFSRWALGISCSIAAKAPGRSAVVWAGLRASISRRISACSRAGLPTTTLGGEDIKRSVKTSPWRLSSTICRASSLAFSKRLWSVGLKSMDNEASTTKMRCAVPPPLAARPGRCQYGSATASTKSMIIAMRIKSNNHCSKNIRRVCRLTAASRNSIAAQVVCR